MSTDRATTVDYRLLSLPGPESEQEQTPNIYRRTPDDPSRLMDSTLLYLVDRLVPTAPRVYAYWLLGLSTQQVGYRALAETVRERSDPLAELERVSQLVSAAWKPGKSALDLLLEGRR
jgi:hypothetical protein